MPLTKHFLLNILFLCCFSQHLGATSMAPLEITREPVFFQNFTGDFDEIEERRIIRFLVPYSKTFFFLDGAKPKGLIYDNIMAFEKALNIQLKSHHIQVHAVVIPTSRKELLPHLRQGLGDVAAGNLTITDTRLKSVDFTTPFHQDINELLVTNKSDRNYNSLFDLAGKTISVRPSSSYYTSLVRTNKILKDFGKREITIRKIHEQLEDEDILELVNANIIHLTVVDQHKAELWAQLLPNIKIHDTFAINKGGKIAWAIRKDSPKLKQVLNTFIEKNKIGTLAGNMLFTRYFKNTDYLTKALEGKNKDRYQDLIPVFKKYGELYNFNHFLLIALAYQESKLNQKARSSKGAVGIMQILPSTANSPAVNIKNIDQVGANIHAGTKYLRYLADVYFPESEHIDKTNRALFTFAAYNAGPAKVNYLRRKAEQEGYDPNVWFQNVEIVAARHIGRETVSYVSNIMKYYIAYNLLARSQEKITFPVKQLRQTVL